VWSLEARDIRHAATDKHRSVDDTPAGGGPGMVLRADVLAAAIDAAEIAPERPRLLMSPRGTPLTQKRVMELAAGPGPLIVCGRFEGIDQRVIEARGLEEVSIGDYVLSGGEIAALALIDACVRLLPGVMGKQALEPTRVSRTDYWNTPSIPARRNSKAGPSRMCWFRATTPGSRPGGGRKPRP
jgi:tRNA (guanine37-N1)-methyltransferase